MGLNGGAKGSRGGHNVSKDISLFIRPKEYDCDGRKKGWSTV